MDLTSSFAALVPWEERDTEKMKHTNTGGVLQDTHTSNPEAHTHDAHVCVQNSITHLLILHRDI